MDDEKKPAQYTLVGSACAAAGHIFVDNSTPGRLKETLQKAETTLQMVCRLSYSPKEHALGQEP